MPDGVGGENLSRQERIDAVRADVILCDYAQVHHGKLFVSGGGIAIVGTHASFPPYPVAFSIAGTVTVPWSGAERSRRLMVAIDTVDGERLHLVPPGPSAIGEWEIGAFVVNLNVANSAVVKPADDVQVPFAFDIRALVPHRGAHVATVHVDGIEVSRTRFRIAVAMPDGGFDI